MTKFNKLKTWLKDNNIYYQETKKNNFIEIPGIFSRVYNDHKELSFDSPDKFVTYSNNKDLYKDLIKEIKKI